MMMMTMMVNGDGKVCNQEKHAIGALSLSPPNAAILQKIKINSLFLMLQSSKR